MKDGAYVITINEYDQIGPRWVLKILKIIKGYILIISVLNKLEKRSKVYRQKNIKANIFRIQAYNPIMCGTFVLCLLIVYLTKSNG